MFHPIIDCLDCTEVKTALRSFNPHTAATVKNLLSFGHEYSNYKWIPEEYFQTGSNITHLVTDLAKLAAVKEESRGLVITLSGSVLFASNKSSLLPAAQSRLNQVTEALMATKERTLVVEGHTDSQGAADFNLQLSQQRADAVRDYIISRGYSSSLISAKGIGKERPVSDNSNVEGRANNRRVEIVVGKEIK